jgi:hypothetical protein
MIRPSMAPDRPVDRGMEMLGNRAVVVYRGGNPRYREKCPMNKIR